MYLRMLVITKVFLLYDLQQIPHLTKMNPLFYLCPFNDFVNLNRWNPFSYCLSLSWFWSLHLPIECCRWVTVPFPILAKMSGMLLFIPLELCSATTQISWSTLSEDERPYGLDTNSPSTAQSLPSLVCDYKLIYEPSEDDLGQTQLFKSYWQ